MNKLILNILLIIFLNVEVYATETITPSFDCVKASTKVEKMICSNPELAKKDRELNDYYNKYINFLLDNHPEFKDILVKAQQNWLKERNKITDMGELLLFYITLVNSYREAYEPSFHPAPMSLYNDEDVVFYWMYLPLSFYFKHGYVNDTKNNSIYILYSNDEICQNLLSYKVLDFKDFKNRAEIVTKYYKENKDGTMQEKSSAVMSAKNTYITKYDNGYMGIDNGRLPMSFRKFKKNHKGYYVPYINYDIEKNYHHKSISRDKVWENIVLMQQDAPLDDGVSSEKHVIKTLNVPVIYDDKVYKQVITVLNEIRYIGIDYDKEPPVYDKSISIEIASPLTSIYSYNDDGSTSLACVYTNSISALNNKFFTYLLQYSNFEGSSLLFDYLDKPIRFLDYF